MTTKRMGKAGATGWLILAAMAGWVFHGTFAGLFDRWWNDPAYSHGLLVGPAALVFIYMRRERLGRLAAGGSTWGAAALAASLALFFAGRLGNMLFLQGLAFIGTVAGLALLLEGWAFLWAALLPIAYLIFMCPLPSGLYDAASGQLRLLASAVSTALLQMSGVPATSAGNIIYLPNATLSVEDACSGIRSLFGILATATAFAFVAPGGTLRKSVLVLSAAPIAVFTNILRVTGTGWLEHTGRTAMAEGFYHQFEGWVFYVVAIALLGGLYAATRAVFPVARGGGEDAPGGDARPEDTEVGK